jgi:hypothetical protein
LVKRGVIDSEYYHIKKSFSLIMARLLRIEFAGAFYQVTSRVNERKPIFKSLRDREKEKERGKGGSGLHS